MYFSSWADFFNMGGHGLYVWTSYAITFLVVTYNLIAPVRRKQSIKTQVQRQARLDAARKKQFGTADNAVADNAVADNAVADKAVLNNMVGSSQ